MLTMRRVVLPQAMRVIIPPTGNETISMLKNSSLVFVTGGVNDLLNSVVLIYSVTFQQIPLLIVASIWYLAATTVLSIGQYYVERHYGRGGPGAQSEPLLHRIFRGIAARHDEAGTQDAGPAPTFSGHNR
jgi:ABC-type arginine transport system permease subunit